ncbi:hypothetical protein CTH30272_02131 [Allocatenococcus thiocycli]|nr:hypothetical protein CTH30272_02131 [Catenococcus thiocycli]
MSVTIELLYLRGLLGRGPQANELYSLVVTYCGVALVGSPPD